MADPQTLASVSHYLQQTLSQDASVRQAAEAYLSSIEGNAVCELPFLSCAMCRLVIHEA